MKNSINFQLLSNAARYRSSNPLVNAILVLIILVLVPLLLVAGAAVLISLVAIAKIKTLFSIRDANVTTTARKNNRKDAEDFTDYVVVDEQVGK